MEIQGQTTNSGGLGLGMRAGPCAAGIRSLSPNFISRGNEAGFTLIEIGVVLLIIAVIAAVTAPQLIPIIMFSEHEGTARRLANVGEAAMAHVALTREPIVLRFDLENQAVEAVHWVAIDAEAGEGEEAVDQLALLDEFKSGGGEIDPMAFATMAMGGQVDPGTVPEGFDPELANMQLNDKFDRFARAQLEARAQNVKHEGGILDEVGDLFEEDDEFELEEVETEEQFVDDPLLERFTLPLGTAIDTVWIDGERYRRGAVEVELSAVGLMQFVGLYVVNEDGEYYTVVWDPITASVNVMYGAVELGA